MESEKLCEKCRYLVKINTPDTYEVDCFVENSRPIENPPQSYMYVEELWNGTTIININRIRRA